MITLSALQTKMYDLFSRGAKDWMRHNVKVRDAVKANLPDLLANTDAITRPDSNRTVRVPVKFLEHSRFRLTDPGEGEGPGQGEGDVGNVLRPGTSPNKQPGQPQQGPGGTGNGEIEFIVELKLDEVIDYLWEELKLPDLKPKRTTTLEDPDYIKEGINRTGARSRLDRRRTVKEAIKRRGMQEDAIPFTNEDLRFRQLVKRSKPSTNAVVFFALDVSGSMDESLRKLAKTFFFFALQGIRRRYSKVDVVFVAHSDEAWEFDEKQFFDARSSGGTVSSTAFMLVQNIIDAKYDPTMYNTYFFYASDGGNAEEDFPDALAALTKLSKVVNYAGYIETLGGTFGDAYGPEGSTLAKLFKGLKANGAPVGMSPMRNNNDVWTAIKEFFKEDEKHL
jgi:uncharacterized sporulation protein YeaH/YhbH (DUF444 family)